MTMRKTSKAITTWLMSSVIMAISGSGKITSPVKVGLWGRLEVKKAQNVTMALASALKSL